MLTRFGLLFTCCKGLHVTLQSRQHPATKDSIRLIPLGTRLMPHTSEPKERPCPWPSWSQALPLQCPEEAQECLWTTTPCWQPSHPWGLQARATHNVVPLQMPHHRHGRGQEQHQTKTKHLKWSCSRQQETVLRQQSVRNLPGA